MVKMNVEKRLKNHYFPDEKKIYKKKEENWHDCRRNTKLTKADKNVYLSILLIGTTKQFLFDNLLK